MSLRREQLLNHVNSPLQSTAQLSSPTKSTYHLRWREICEWTDFTTEAEEFWDSLDDAEKSQVIPETPISYWDTLSYTLTAVMTSVSREGRLVTPFTFRPHNQAIPEARDIHARITTRIPGPLRKVMYSVTLLRFWFRNKEYSSGHKTVFPWAANPIPLVHKEFRSKAAYLPSMPPKSTPYF